MLKKIKGLVIAGLITVASLGVVAPASAETTAGWTYIGGDSFTAKGDGGHIGSTVSSKGGQIQIKTQSYNGGTLKMFIYEEDEAGNPDEFIESRTLSGGFARTDNINVENYVDGSNNRAEIYVLYQYDNVTGNVSTSIYD